MMRQTVIGALALLATPVLADQVKLTTTDGFIEIEGDLTSFEGGILTVETSVGMVRLPADEVTCEGVGCPLELASQTEVPVPEVVAPTPAPDPQPEPAATLAASTGGFGLSAGNPGTAALTGDLAAAYGAATGIAVAEGTAASGGTVALLGQSGDGPATADLIVESAPSALGGAGTAIALGGLVVMVSEDIEVGSISLDILARIYAGEITDWSEIGGPELQIEPYLPAEGAVLRGEVEEMILAPYGRSIASDMAGIDTDAELERAMRLSRGAIAITGYPAPEGARLLAVGGACAPAVAPSTFTLKSGSYPLTRTITLRSDGETPDEAATAFLDWAAGPDGQAAIAGIAPLGLGIESGGGDYRASRVSAAMAPTGPTTAAQRAASLTMAGALFGAERLSLTFRGEGGADPRDIARLVALLRTADFFGSRILFAGFDSNAGVADGGMARSRADAQSILEAFREQAAGLPASNGLRFESRGFGAAAPLACETTALGAGLNRRVEVWVTRR